MASNGTNHRPKPEPVWIALGIVVWAVAVALGPKRRQAFIDTLAELTDDHAARRRVIGFEPPQSRSRALSQSVLVAAAWLQRLIGDLKAGFR
jgi:hypothetical protein